jgi:nucleoside-diphosphate-sugar epimerase
MTTELAERFRGKRVLITGGLGFLGSNLARTLAAAGAEVTLIDSLVDHHGANLFNVVDIADLVRVNISDARDQHTMRYLVHKQEILFNLAGQTSHIDSMLDPYSDFESNCHAQLSILEACRHGNPDIRIVFASTRQIYGRPQRLPVSEDHAIAPVDVNGINKTAGEWYHLLYGAVYGLAISVLRLTNTYGPRMRVRDARQTFLGHWIQLILTGRSFHVFGDGSQRRDLNYVDDATSAFLLAASEERAIGEVYNLGGDKPITLLDLARLLVEINGSGAYEIRGFPEDRNAIDIGDYFADCTKIERDLGWRPSVSLEEGLAKTLSYYRTHGSHYYEVCG